MIPSSLKSMSMDGNIRGVKIDGEIKMSVRTRSTRHRKNNN
jgi:hypothetical protein